jgi:phenylacetate-coenzyme A ligase PaaK-like adenylate-forming protein
MLRELGIVLGKAREHRAVARMTRAEFEALKLAKFRALVRHANERSPYYARIVRERGIEVAACVPQDFPVLTKAQLMASFDEIVTVPALKKDAIAEFLTRSKDPAELMLGRYRVIHTSGSSGEVGYFVYSPEDWLRGSWAPRRRRPQLTKKRSRGGRFRLAYFGATDGHYAGVTMIRSLQRGLARLFVDVRTYEVNRPLAQTIADLNAFAPDFLAGYTTALKILADKQRSGELRLNLMGVGTAGEVTTEGDRTYLQAAFDCGLVNTYGCSEHLGMGSSLPGGSEIVLTDHELIYEMYADHSVVTNLFNYTLPLIRYRMADVLRPVEPGPHAPYLVIESLVGRNELQPTFKNRDGVDDFVSPHTINEVFVAGVTRFQMHLLGDSEFKFMVCLDSRLSAAERAACVAAVERRLGEILAKKLMDNVRFTVVVADDLPVDPRTRKFQLIVDARRRDAA